MLHISKKDLISCQNKPTWFITCNNNKRDNALAAVAMRNDIRYKKQINNEPNTAAMRNAPQFSTEHNSPAETSQKHDGALQEPPASV
jgi:hypothetical protein